MSEAPAADYALKVVEALASNASYMGISDISRETGINKNAVSRVLGSLCESGWVYQDGLRYQLTLKPFRLTSGALSRLSFYGASRPFITELWELTGDSCYGGILHDNSVMYLTHLDSRRDLKIAGRVGGSYPLHTTAPGKVLLSYADKEYRRRYFDGICTDKVYAEGFETDAERVRANGYATDIEEYGPGIICFAAPVFDIDGSVVGTVGISTSTVYCKPCDLVGQKGKYVLDAAHKISGILGYEGNDNGNCRL